MAEKEEIITPECLEIKDGFEIKINNSKLKIEINDDDIKFIIIIGISYYKYIKKYKYEEIIKKLDILECKDIKKVYEYLIKSEYKIINKEKIKKLIINKKI